MPHSAVLRLPSSPPPATPAEPIVRRERDLKWDPLLVCVAGYVLTSVGRVHQLFGFLEVFHLAAVTGVLAIALYVIDSSNERMMRSVWGSTAMLFAGLLFWMILSIPSALVVSNSFDLVVNNFLKTAVMSLIIAASVRDVRDVERLAFVYFAGAVIYSGVVFNRFDVTAGSPIDWRLGRLYYYDANDFATFVVTAIPLGVYFLHAGSRAITRLFAAVGLAMLALGFVWAGSRGGFIALGAVVGFILLRYSAIPVRWRMSATALIVAVVLVAATDQFWEQMGTITSETDYNQTEETGRLQIWRRGIGYMFGNPLLGVGPDNFRTAEGTLSAAAERQQYGIGVRWNAAHNSFVQIGAELGIPGLTLFVALILSAFRALRRSGRREASGRAPLTPAVTASLLGFVVGAFFLSLGYSEMLYTLIAFAVGLQKVTCDTAAR